MRTIVLIWILLTVPVGVGLFLAAWRVRDLGSRFGNKLFWLLLSIATKDFFMTLALLSRRDTWTQNISLIVAQSVGGIGAWMFAIYMVSRMNGGKKRDDKLADSSKPDSTEASGQSK